MSNLTNSNSLKTLLAVVPMTAGVMLSAVAMIGFVL